LCHFRKEQVTCSLALAANEGSDLFNAAETHIQKEGGNVISPCFTLVQKHDFLNAFRAKFALRVNLLSEVKGRSSFSRKFVPGYEASTWFLLIRKQATPPSPYGRAPVNKTAAGFQERKSL
jgi:hypothetical protein